MALVTTFIQKRLISVELLLAMERWMRYADTGPAAGRLILALIGGINDATNLVDSLASLNFSSLAATWIKPVLDAVHRRPELIENLEQHLLPELLRMNLSHTEELLRTLPIEELCRGNIGRLTEEDLRLCLVVIRVVEELGTTSLLDTLMNSLDLHNLSYTQRVSIDLLMHDSASVRILALRSLTYSSSSIVPLPSYLFSTLRRVIPCFHAETDSAARNEFCSITKKLFSRIQAVMHRLTKSINMIKDANTQPEAYPDYSFEEGYECLVNHAGFVSWYIELLLKELQPTASYPRHISALKVLQLLNASGLCSTVVHSSLISSQAQEPSQPIELNKSPFVHLLLDLVMNPFDDVRAIAASLLHEHYTIAVTKPTLSGISGLSIPSHDSLWDCSTLERVLQRSAALSRRTGRADYADGVGRFYHLRYLFCGKNEKLDDRRCERHLLFERLISDLEIDVQVAHDNLQIAVASAPLHGHLIALRYTVSHKEFFQLSELGSQDWRRMHNRLVRCCSMIWIVVKDVICYDSPEGHIVIEAEEDESDVHVKDALSYSWRALKETSALIHAMISNLGYSPLSSDGGLSYEDLKILGDLTLIQLAELRHRGAFSTVSQTFLACCVRCAASEDLEIAELPGLWYRETLLCIEAKAAALTRRSAGLPAMITGILAAYPNGSFFDTAILDLQKIANAPVVRGRIHTDIRLSQVHALNCLKDIFTNSRLGSSTENHLATTLVIAINCVDKDVWAIRNCGLMLLKALLTRLVGGTGKTPRHGSQPHPCGSVSSITYEKYEVLADLVLRLLQHQSSDNSSAENVIVSDDQLNTEPVSIQMVFPAMEIIERIGVAASHELLVEQLLLTHLDSPVWNLREKAATILSNLIEKEVLFSNVYFLMQEGRRHTLKGRADIEDLSDTLDGLLRIRVSTNTCLVSAAVLLDVESFIVERLLIGRFRVILESGRRCLLTEDVEYIALLPWRGGKNQNLLQRWKHTVDDLCKTTTNSRIHITDSFISAVARARVLSALLDDTSSDCGLLTPDVLQNLNKDGNIAVYAGIQCFNSMHGMFDPLRVQPLQIYTMLLQQSLPADSRIPLMEGLSAFLSSLSQSDGTAEVPVLTALITFGDEHMDLVSWEQQEQMTDPRTQNATLKLRGALLAHACRVGSLEDSRLKLNLEIWARMLKLAGDVRSDLSTRLAAASSIDYFKKALRPEHSELCSASAFLGIYLALYDFLLDDDEEVRGIGALVVSWIFSIPKSSREPASARSVSICSIVAVDMLVSYLLTAYRESNVLLYEGLSRLTGRELAVTHNKNSVGSAYVPQAEVDDFLLPIRDLFEIARKEDTSLFVEEKQNLYIDPAQESQRWAFVLVHISPATLKNSITSSFVEWALAGLECLVDIAAQEAGGPLGWTTKPEVFTLGIRVLETAQVLRNWEKRGLIKQIPNLKSLMTKLKRADIHPVWLSRITEE
ncbi:hypothetical protein MMC17_009709 [Xylographa soralifera]|nr:hypothetical protein [Xylographa soralifera]